MYSARNQDKDHRMTHTKSDAKETVLYQIKTKKNDAYKSRSKGSQVMHTKSEEMEMVLYQIKTGLVAA